MSVYINDNGCVFVYKELYGYTINDKSAMHKKVSWQNVDNIEAMKKIVDYWKNKNLDTSFSDYMVARAIWGIAKDFSIDDQLFKKLQRTYDVKGLFRDFLTKHGFNVPHAKRYTDKKAPFNDIDFFTWPVIVKPVDSAGSKGVTKVDSPDKLADAIETAVGGSHNGAYIIEDFLTFKGYHSSADPFTVDGELKFVSYSDQLFDKEADNPYTPAYIIWTTSMAKEDQDYLTKETQRLLTLLGMKTGIYNIETCVGSDGKPYIMEVSPRGGGCKIAELQRLAYGVDLIENEVRKAVGMPLTEIKQTECDGHWCEMVIHARPGQSGVLKGIKIDPEIEKKYVKVVDLSVKPGDFVEPFTGANMSLGDMFLRFDSREELDDVMGKSKEWLTIQLEEK